MKNYLYRGLIITLIPTILLSSCITTSYTPNVSLEKSPITIEKIVKIEKLIDNTNTKYKEKPFLGISVTNENILSSSLDYAVTKAIMLDFSKNNLFHKIDTININPDLIIQGEIKKFYGKTHPNIFAKVNLAVGIVAAAVFIATVPKAITQGDTPAAPISLLVALTSIFSPYLGIPITKNTVEIEITLNIYNSRYELLGSYKSNIVEKKSTNHYQNEFKKEDNSIENITNIAFSKAVENLRNQIIGDFDILN